MRTSPIAAYWVVCCLMLLSVLLSPVHAATTTAKPPSAATVAANAAAAANAKMKSDFASQSTRLAQLEKANKDALTRNQTLQLENDNLAVQVKVLQGERSAQMFLYGAATIAAGAILGFLFAGMMQRRNRRW